jgi:hypothetical protein
MQYCDLICCAISVPFDTDGFRLILEDSGAERKRLFNLTPRSGRCSDGYIKLGIGCEIHVKRVDLVPACFLLILITLSCFRFYILNYTLTPLSRSI